MKKKINFAADVQSWLAYAVYDLKTAKWEFKGRIYTSTCYSCQQVAEKALKALLLAKGKILPRVHSLDYLVKKLKNLKIDISSIEEKAEELEKYYISTRYPGQYGGPEGLYDQKDATSAIEAAEIILNFVKKETNL